MMMKYWNENDSIIINDNEMNVVLMTNEVLIMMILVLIVIMIMTIKNVKKKRNDN